MVFNPQAVYEVRKMFFFFQVSDLYVQLSTWNLHWDDLQASQTDTTQRASCSCPLPDKSAISNCWLAPPPAFPIPGRGIISCYWLLRVVLDFLTNLVYPVPKHFSSLYTFLHLSSHHPNWCIVTSWVNHRLHPTFSPSSLAFIYSIHPTAARVIC